MACSCCKKAIDDNSGEKVMACSCCKKAIDDNSGCDIHKEDKATCDNLNDSSLFKAMENTGLCLDVVFDWACEIYAHHIAVDGRLVNFNNKECFHKQARSSLRAALVLFEECFKYYTDMNGTECNKGINTKSERLSFFE